MLTNCRNCNKQFDISPSRSKAKTICCSRKCSSEYKIKNRTNLEKCPVCEKQFHLKPFHKKRYKGPFCCSRNCRGKFLETYYIGEKNPNFRFKDSLEKYFYDKLVTLKLRSKKENLDFNLDIDCLINMYNNQKGLCFYTKIPMQLVSISWSKLKQPQLDVLSVDKIQPKLGYIKNNIVFCCNGINKMKGNASIQELNYFIEKLRINYNEFKLKKEI